MQPTCLLAGFCWEIFLRPWRGSRYVPPKCRLHLNRLHDVTSQKKILFLWHYGLSISLPYLWRESWLERVCIKESNCCYVKFSQYRTGHWLRRTAEKRRVSSADAPIHLLRCHKFPQPRGDSQLFPSKRIKYTGSSPILWNFHTLFLHYRCHSITRNIRKYTALLALDYATFSFKYDFKKRNFLMKCHTFLVGLGEKPCQY
jgi:hypothetical protein